MATGSFLKCENKEGVFLEVVAVVGGRMGVSLATGQPQLTGAALDHHLQLGPLTLRVCVVI